MYCKHLAAEMDPLQPGEEVEMSELPAGTCETFFMVMCQAAPSVSL